VRILDDFLRYVEVTQDALLLALERWPLDGIPERPGAWLLTVDRRRALNQLSRDARYREKLAQLEQPIPREPDDRQRLMFTCCHPALARASQVALTLRAVCGFTTGQIAHAFLASESAVAQRIVRARRKIVASAIPCRIPSPTAALRRLGERHAV
jgi:predicted RNA polymerase sigma factor